MQVLSDKVTDVLDVHGRRCKGRIGGDGFLDDAAVTVNKVRIGGDCFPDDAAATCNKLSCMESPNNKIHVSEPC